MSRKQNQRHVDAVPPAILKGKGIARREDPPPALDVKSTSRLISPTGPSAAVQPAPSKLAAASTPVILKPAAPVRREEKSAHAPAVKPLETGKLILSHLDHVLLDPISKFLMDNTDFTAVGVIGSEGIGKSFIMNELALPDDFSSAPSPTPEPFAQWSDTDEAALTRGVDFALRVEDRTVWLDTQPLQAASVLAAAFSSSAPAAADDSEAAHERASLEIIALVASSCHAMIVVDGPYGPAPPLIRLLRAARMLSPAVETDQQQQPQPTDSRWPSIVYVANRGEERTAKELESIASAIQKLIGPPLVRVDVAVVPQRGLVSAEEYSRAIRQLRRAVYSAGAAGQAAGGSSQAGKSEREWLRSLTRNLAAVRSAPLIAEYCKMNTRPPKP